MKTTEKNWVGAYWVESSFESADGGSGWDNEYFGPFHTKSEAFAVAQKLYGCGKPAANKSKYIVEVKRSLTTELETSCENGDVFPGAMSNYFDEKYCGLRKEFAEF